MRAAPAAPPTGVEPVRASLGGWRLSVRPRGQRGEVRGSHPSRLGHGQPSSLDEKPHQERGRSRADGARTVRSSEETARLVGYEPIAIPLGHSSSPKKLESNQRTFACGISSSVRTRAPFRNRTGTARLRGECSTIELKGQVRATAARSMPCARGEALLRPSEEAGNVSIGEVPMCLSS